MYNSYSPIPLIVEITSFSQCQFVVVYMKAEEYDMLCMGHKIKLAKRVLCVFFSVFLMVSLLALWMEEMSFGSLLGIFDLLLSGNGEKKPKT